MANSIYNKYRNISQGYQRPQSQQNNNPLNLLSQIRQVQQNPGLIADILLQNGKITQQQYEEIQPFKDNPQQVGQYLISKGYGGEISQIQQQANNLKG